MTATAHWRWSEWKRQADVTLYIVCNLLFSLSHVLQLSSHSWAKDSQKKQQPSFNTPLSLFSSQCLGVGPHHMKKRDGECLHYLQSCITWHACTHGSPELFIETLPLLSRLHRKGELLLMKPRRLGEKRLDLQKVTQQEHVLHFILTVYSGRGERGNVITSARVCCINVHKCFLDFKYLNHVSSTIFGFVHIWRRVRFRCWSLLTFPVIDLLRLTVPSEKWTHNCQTVLNN